MSLADLRIVRQKSKPFNFITELSISCELLVSFKILSERFKQSTGSCSETSSTVMQVGKVVIPGVGLL